MTVDAPLLAAAPRPPLLAQGVSAAVLALALLLVALPGTVPLAVLVVAVQILLMLGFLALVDAPAATGIFAITTVSALAADVVVIAAEEGIGGLAGVVGLAFVASLVHQLVRRDRSRVTESLADTLVAVALVVSASCLLALRELEGGREAVAAVLAAAGAALLAGRIADRIAPRPLLAVGATRGWPGLVLALGAGALAATAAADGPVMGAGAALLGLVVAAAVAAGDLAVDLGAAELRDGPHDARRVAALRPVGLLLPFAVLGPVAFVAGRLVLA